MVIAAHDLEDATLNRSIENLLFPDIYIALKETLQSTSDPVIGLL